jgi:nucleoid-associated protein YgaU
MAAPDPTSRYAGLAEIRVVAPDGTTRIFGAPRAVPAPPLRGSYTVRPGDRLDLLAHVAAGDSTRWWLLADANPFAGAARLEEPGQTIDLPDA